MSWQVFASGPGGLDEGVEPTSDQGMPTQHDGDGRLHRCLSKVPHEGVGDFFRLAQVMI